MAGYSRLDFYRLYSASPTCPETNRRYTEIRLHYHPALRARMGFDRKAKQLIAKGIVTPSDRVLMPGCAFGWLGEELMKQCGCVCMGVEVSDYVFEYKDRDGNYDLMDAILASRKCNYTADEGIGKEIYDKFYSHDTYGQIGIVKGDYAEGPVDLGSFTPTKIITEDLANAVPDDVWAQIEANLKELQVPMYHLIDGVIV